MNKLKKDVLLEIMIFALGILFISLFWANNLLVTSLLFLLWLIALKFGHKKDDFIFFVTGAIIGPTAEMICVKFFTWQYSNPLFLGIPPWLPLAWGVFVVLIKRISETITKKNS
jgi:hypothetical protein